VYELSDAFDGRFTEIKKELGDVLLHLVFYAKIGSEKNVLILQMLLIL
jgi:XTP/dITP diphosphohydrolase